MSSNADGKNSEHFDDLFAEKLDLAEITNTRSATPWKILIVDDEPDVHAITKMVLDDFEFEGRPLELISAFSGAEAKGLMKQHPDVAMMLLDVVMETDHAGLDTVKFVREELKNKNVRIILRTGQPGQAPEKEVITKYDINDYKEKTELTQRKLFTLAYAALRSYRDIVVIEKNKQGLEKVIVSSANIFHLKSLKQFSSAVLEQMSNLLMAESGALFKCNNGLAARCQNGDFQVLSGIGDYAIDKAGLSKFKIPLELKQLLTKAVKAKKNIYTESDIICYFKTSNEQENVFLMSGVHELSELDKSLLEIFTRNVSIAFENVELHDEIEETQREIVYLLGEAVETRSKETGNHVKRVAEVSKILATAAGLDDNEAEIMRLASPLHDLGKIGIPDSILNKPGRLTDEERVVMNTHARLGCQMLSSSKRRILKAAAIIADQHHERWDGGGYPDGLEKEKIHIYGRITALADVFDALGSDRCYKKAWPLDEVLDYVKDQKGKQFDPQMVDHLIENIEEIVAINTEYKDAVIQP